MSQRQSGGMASRSSTLTLSASAIASVEGYGRIEMDRTG